MAEEEQNDRASNFRRIHASDSLDVGLKEAPTVRVKENLSQLLLRTAEDLASVCEDLEREEGCLPWPQEGWSRLMGSSMASVMTAVAALEASINEFYLEAADRNANALESMTDQQMALLEELWIEVEKAAIISKYQIALTACGREPVDRGSEPFQSAVGLVRLRNALVHFKPEWRDEQKEHKALELELRSKFEPNALAAQAEGRMTWFPGKCLGAGCARWACSTVRNFVSTFSEHMGVRKRF